ncbi:MAG TPA: acyl-CoA dehydrogenase [Rugosimonospora sp.]
MTNDDLMGDGPVAGDAAGDGTSDGAARAWHAWWRVNRPGGDRPGPVAEVVRRARVDGMLDLPPPGGGDTARRWAALARWGRADPVFARLAEGHVDAVAILAELGGPDPGPWLWGVWAAVPRSLTATRGGEGWLLKGERPWCSGAGGCQRALVTARDGEQIRLFAVDVAQTVPIPGTWPAVGMAASDSRTVRFADTSAQPVGEPGRYVDRPGFWHGGIGVAACWYGVAAGVADSLRDAARERDIGPHALAHLGAVAARLAACQALLDRSAAFVDADPGRRVPGLAARVRAVAEATATEVLDRVGRALGAGPLCLDAAHARRVADLTVYLRQSHAESDLAALGELVRDATAAGGAAAEGEWWPW